MFGIVQVTGKLLGYMSTWPRHSRGNGKVGSGNEFLLAGLPMVFSVPYTGPTEILKVSISVWKN